MELAIGPAGHIRCLYGEAIELSQLGRLTIHRASHVEPDEEGRWFADLSPLQGPSLGPFESRSQALAAEEDWLIENWLSS